MKPGREQEALDRVRKANADASQRQGLRKRTFIRLGGPLFCTILEWDSPEALADARPQNRVVVDAIRDLLEERADVGVTFAVAGEAVCEFAEPAADAPAQSLGQPRAWNILRYHVKRESKDMADTIARAALPPTAAAPTPGLRRIAVVQVGDLSFCVLAEWDSYDQLPAGAPAVIQRLETFRDALEGVPGGLGVIQASAGTVADESVQKA